ncbi:MAG: hypothetical protein ACRDSN_13585, partial [Pseudonocardiaceae bacterium]
EDQQVGRSRHRREERRVLTTDVRDNARQRRGPSNGAVGGGSGQGSSWFMQNFSEDYMLEHVLSGDIRLPAGDAHTPFIDADDIADVPVAALTDDRHIGQLYELTGSRSLTFADAAAEIAEESVREVRYVPVSLDEHAAEAAVHGVPPEVVELLTYLFRKVLDGRNADTTDGVRRALCREPRDFREYAREAAVSGVWNASAVAA